MFFFCLLYLDFYSASDKYGLLIHDDFWLANPNNGPNPQDDAMVMVCMCVCVWMFVYGTELCECVAKRRMNKKKRKKEE
jgi:hypothetical protein